MVGSSGHRRVSGRLPRLGGPGLAEPWKAGFPLHFVDGEVGWPGKGRLRERRRNSWGKAPRFLADHASTLRASRGNLEGKRNYTGMLWAAACALQPGTRAPSRAGCFCGEAAEDGGGTGERERWGCLAFAGAFAELLVPPLSQPGLGGGDTETTRVVR